MRFSEKRHPRPQGPACLQKVRRFESLAAKRVGCDAKDGSDFLKFPSRLAFWHPSFYHSSASRTMRNPSSLHLRSGAYLSRKAERHVRAVRPQPPPRKTRDDPVGGPLGLRLRPSGYFSYQSWHHSNTFPCMSCRPQVLGSFFPTGWISSSVFPQYHPTLSRFGSCSHPNRAAALFQTPS